MSRNLGRILIAALIVADCSSSDGGGPTITTPTSTWERILATTIQPSCLEGCHASGQKDATESGLVLNSNVAYQNLVGINTKNAAAKTHGMLRVKPGDPDASFFYWKLLFLASPAGHDYGAGMPLGRPPLTNGEIDYIRRWIIAGAPAAGEVVDTAVLRDKTRLNVENFTALAPPPVGYQLHIDAFNISPKFEREIFVYSKVGNNTDVFVNRIETKMRAGSHHFIAYTFRTATPFVALPLLNTVRDIRNPDGSLNIFNMIPMAYHVFLGGSMTQISDYRFPTGVALRLPAGIAVDLNAHYVNSSTAAMTGEAYINFHATPQSQVQFEAKALDMNNTSITLPPGQRTTVAKSFTVSEKMTVFLLTSHMHARGEKFVIRIKGGARDGEVVYENTDWEHPLMQGYPTPIVLQPGQGLTSEITYNNTTSRTISFGLTSEDEMGIIFGYYY
ncbi:MAG TPA: hypothetical protein VM100_01190 [Longimicrobiales bacterium]|nr:hypothetical protein [Longimicrobiales bacterium]